MKIIEPVLVQIDLANIAVFLIYYKYYVVKISPGGSLNLEPV